MKLMPPKHDPSRKAAKPTKRPAKRHMPPGKKAAPKNDPDMDHDAGMPEDAASEEEEKEPAVNYAAMARKSRPTVI